MDVPELNFRVRLHCGSIADAIGADVEPLIRLVRAYARSDARQRAEILVAAQTMAEHGPPRREPTINAAALLTEGRGRFKARLEEVMVHIPGKGLQRCQPTQQRTFRFETREARDRWLRLWDCRASTRRYCTFTLSAERERRTDGGDSAGHEG